MQDNKLGSIRGYAANEQSCTSVIENGIGTMNDDLHPSGAGVYFFQAYASPGDVVAPGKPLTLGNRVFVYRLFEGEPFDLVKWNFLPGHEGLLYSINVTNGLLSAIGNDGHIY